MTLVVVMPSRGRPFEAHRAIAELRRTAARVDTSVILAVDSDDLCQPKYEALRWPGYGPEVSLVTLVGDETGDLVRATNTVAVRVAQDDPAAIIANFGDDHHARSHGWDSQIFRALDRPGIAYGDDLFQGEALPTAPFVSAAIVNALGWYFLPGCTHLFVDNVLRDLGHAADCLTYLPDVVIEHRHPLAGKGRWDEGYERANGDETVERDKAAYNAWRAVGMGFHVERIRQALRVAA